MDEKRGRPRSRAEGVRNSGKPRGAAQVVQMRVCQVRQQCRPEKSVRNLEMMQGEISLHEARVNTGEREVQGAVARGFRQDDLEALEGRAVLLQAHLGDAQA